MQLTHYEIRIIGCLIEKSLTTPDQYPLSINALTNACNQKSNRDPVLTLTEVEVQDIVDSLMEKRLIVTQFGKTNRVSKYRHRFCNSEFGDLQFTPQELGIICVLFLRGPQTPGELRTRTNRLCQFTNVQETEEVLKGLEEAEKGPYVIKLSREPGRRESRYVHCFSELETVSEKSDEATSQMKAIPDSDRVTALEERVELMELEIDELRQQLDELLK